MASANGHSVGRQVLGDLLINPDIFSMTPNELTLLRLVERASPTTGCNSSSEGNPTPLQVPQINPEPGRDKHVPFLSEQFINFAGRHTG